MATYSRVLLSGSTDGLPIKVTATATPGTTIHTAHATALDEVYLWITNLDSTDRTITIEWGGTTDPDHLVAKGLTIPANSALITVVTGPSLTNSKVVKVFASAANVITVVGHVNRVA